MDQNSWDLYDQYLTDKTVKYTDNTELNQYRFKGKRIIPLNAIPKDTIVGGVFTNGMDSNLWMAVDYASDENVLQIDKLQNNSELYFFKMLLKVDVNIVRPGEIVIWTPYVSSATVTYTAVSSTTGKNPADEGWYERSGSEGSYVYTLTKDVAPASGKTYYQKVVS
jgi:hypothetical protein